MSFIDHRFVQIATKIGIWLSTKLHGCKKSMRRWEENETNIEQYVKP